MTTLFGITTISFTRLGNGDYCVTGIRKSNGKAIVRTFITAENADRQVIAWDQSINPF
jgi:hypothetical protein